MPNHFLSLRVIALPGNPAEVLHLHRDNMGWRSHGGGWMGPRAGVWVQRPDGMHLMDSLNTVEIAHCRGLFFEVCFALEHGPLVSVGIRDEGEWEVSGVG